MYCKGKVARYTLFLVATRIHRSNALPTLSYNALSTLSYKTNINITKLMHWSYIQHLLNLMPVLLPLGHEYMTHDPTSMILDIWLRELYLLLLSNVLRIGNCEDSTVVRILLSRIINNTFSANGRGLSMQHCSISH